MTIGGLLPGQRVYFDIISGENVADNGGLHYTVNIPLTLGGPPSHPVFGPAFQGPGTTTAAGAIVFLQADHGEGTDRSQVFSALVDAQGFWNSNIGSLRTDDLGEYFNLTGDARLCIWAIAEGDRRAYECHGLADVSPAGTLILRPKLCVDISIPAGLSLVSLPHAPLRPTKVNELAEQLSRAGAIVLELNRWDRNLGRWDTFIPGTPIEPFLVKAGEPYFIHSLTRVVWRYCGLEISQPIELELAEGLNAIGIPIASRSYTSLSLAEAINAAGGDVRQLDRWDEFLGRWESYVWQYQFNDYEILDQRGYFLIAGGPSSFTP